MCLKDMPSVVVARGCHCVGEPATDLADLVLDGEGASADDRIEAAYAIVELGERASGKEGAELHPSLADEEDLDAVAEEETEQYHQVPRSPECLRSLTRARAVHVRGAVMPTRTVGTPVKTLPQKRRLNHDDGDDEAASGGGIKAKLARMLIQRKFSNEGGAERSNQNGLCRAENVDDSDEEPKGRFVRTAAPVVVRPVDVISHTESAPAASPENPPEFLEAKTEQSISVEEINRLRSSLRERLFNEQVTSLGDSHYWNPSQEFGSKQKVFNFKSNAALNDHEICSSENFSKDVAALSSSYCPSEHVSTSAGKDVNIIKSEVESPLASHCYLPRSANYPNSMPGISGSFLQYYMLPVMKSSPNSVNSEFGGVQPSAVRSNVDALKRLEQLSLGRSFCSEPAPKGDLVVPEAWKFSQNVDGYNQLYGALNGFRGHHHGLSNSSASEATYPLSCLAESLSLQNLSTIQRDSPKLSRNHHKQHQYANSDAMAYESKRPTTIKDGQASCTAQKFESKVAYPRRKPLAVLQAQEMVNGGQFGSLVTIRSLYNRMKSRNVDLSAHIHQNTQHGKLPTKTGRRSLVGVEEQEQVKPLDLSSSHRRMSHCPAKLKVKVESWPTYPPSVQTPAELCIKDDLKATVENCAKSSDVLPLVEPEADVRSGLDNSTSAGDGDKCLNGSSTHSVPNSHLPPKKRKFRQASQNCDFSESRTSPGVKSASTHQVTSHEQKSSQTPVKNRSDQTLETVKGRKSSESDTKVLPDVTADEENMLAAVTIRDEDGDLPLHIAVAQGSVNIVQNLLPAMSKVGVSVNSCNNNRQTALHLAVISNQAQMVDLLLKASASANVCDRKGNTVVHLAIKYKALPCLKKILQSSRIPLNLDARNYEGLTALHIGVQLSEPEAVRALLIGGANPNTMDGTNGRTPLFNAVEANDFTIASTLVEHGSDPFMASYSGCTPLQIAAGKSLREMIGVLEKSGREWPRRIQECV